MSAIGPQIPAQLLNAGNSEDNENEYGPAPPPQVGPKTPSHPTETGHPGPDEEEDEDAYRPALPPDLVAPKRTIGPTLPTNASQTRFHDSDDTSDSEEVGPIPASAASQANSADDAVREFMEREERRRKAGEEARQPKKLQREEWMLVPPSSSSVLGSLDPTKLKARQFSRSAANTAPGARDNSLWTETPAERQARLKDEVDGKRKRATEAPADEDDELKQDDRKRRKYEAEVKAKVEEYNRQTRGSTLVDMHQSAKSKDKNKDEGLPVIWDHARDMSVGGRLMDEGQRSRMIQDARSLGDRFGKGKGGGFL